MNKIKQSILAIVIGLVSSAGVSYAAGIWEDPDCGPTGCNTETPINVGSSDQSKIGRLAIVGGLKVGNSTFTDVSGNSFVAAAASIFNGSADFNSTANFDGVVQFNEFAQFWEDIDISDTDKKLSFGNSSYIKSNINKDIILNSYRDIVFNREAQSDIKFQKNGTNYMILKGDGQNNLGLACGSTSANPDSAYKIDLHTCNIRANLTSGSDFRLKKNIMPLENSLNKILSLNGVSFEWKEKNMDGISGDRRVGLIAQDVENIIPEIVSDDSRGFKSISYDKLTAVLIEAIKEQQKEIDSLKFEIKEIQRLSK